jgi:transcriptional regulator with XRE-family HTH domain
MQEQVFSRALRFHRQSAGFTNRQLAERAGVPTSLIAGLQSGKRRVGEKNALQIGEALGLYGATLEQFVFDGINTCTRKVLRKSQGFPSQLLNFTASKLLMAGVVPSVVTGCSYSGDLGTITLKLVDGRVARLETNLVLT